MFIRQRTRKLKDGKDSTTYQLVDSFRWEGKVKQRVIGLGEHANPQDALKEWEFFLRHMEKNLQTPTSQYKQVHTSYKFGSVVAQMPKPKAEKLRLNLLGEYTKLAAKIECLKGMLRGQKGHDTALQVRSL